MLQLSLVHDAQSGGKQLEQGVDRDEWKKALILTGCITAYFFLTLLKVIYQADAGNEPVTKTASFSLPAY